MALCAAQGGRSTPTPWSAPRPACPRSRRRRHVAMTRIALMTGEASTGFCAVRPPPSREAPARDRASTSRRRHDRGPLAAITQLGLITSSSVDWMSTAPQRHRGDLSRSRRCAVRERSPIALLPGSRRASRGRRLRATARGTRSTFPSRRGRARSWALAAPRARHVVRERWRHADLVLVSAGSMPAPRIRWPTASCQTAAFWEMARRCATWRPPRSPLGAVLKGGCNPRSRRLRARLLAALGGEGGQLRDRARAARDRGGACAGRASLAALSAGGPRD